MSNDPVRNGRLAFAVYQEALLKCLEDRQKRASARREARHPDPIVKRALVVARDPNTGETRVLSELRREFPWHDRDDLGPKKERREHWFSVLSWLPTAVKMIVRKLVKQT